MSVMSSRRKIVGALVTLLALAAGCGDEFPNQGAGQEAIDGPHGWVANEIKGGFGYTEFLFERPTPGSDEEVLAVYFVAPDKKSPMKNLPKSVVLLIDRADGKKVNVPLELTHQPTTGDPMGQARFASKPVKLSHKVSGDLDLIFGDRKVSGDIFTQNMAKSMPKAP